MHKPLQINESTFRTAEDGIGWDGAGPLALKQDRSLDLERTKPLILEQTGPLAIPEPSANGAA
jgi:hypothetical protein